MSINVTVSGNPITIRRGRMVLSDLDQIKKNERDRRRRLRLEQVRQQSKEISNRLLERAKNVAKQELNKLEKDGKSELKRLHERKIMEIQQKYQEDMEDIGQAHAAAVAVIESDTTPAMEDKIQRNKIMASKRGEEALQQLKKAEKDADEMNAAHRDRLQKVRETENLRSSLVTRLQTRSENQTKAISDSPQKEHSPMSTKKKKLKRSTSKKLVGKFSKINTKVCKSPCKPISPRHASHRQKVQATPVPKLYLVSEKSDETNAAQNLPKEDDVVERVEEIECSDETPRETVPVSSICTNKAQKIARYNPEDYMQDSSDAITNGSSSPFSDDSSYFSDGAEQMKCVKTPRHPTSLSSNKVYCYDHSTRQRNEYNRPHGVVERIDVRNEPNAVDAAREIEQAESMETQLAENHKCSAQRRGEDAILREKVRKDYQTLMQNLDHLTAEERKLKASQIQDHPRDNIYLREIRRKQLLEKHKRKLDRAFKTIANNCNCPSQHIRPAERIVTLVPQQQIKDNDAPQATWQKVPCFTTCTNVDEETISVNEEEVASREEQILDMLKKVERQKRLLLKEFGANLPDDIYNASIKSLLEPQETTVLPKAPVESAPKTPEVTVINMSISCDEGDKKGKLKSKGSSPLKKVEIAVQTSELNKNETAQDKGVQVKLTPEENIVDSVDKIATTTPYPTEPIVTIINPEVQDSSLESSNSIVSDEIIDTIPKKRKSNLKAKKRSSPRKCQKSRSITVTDSVKRTSRSLPDDSYHDSPKKIDTSVKNVRLSVNRQSQTEKVFVDGSSQVYSKKILRIRDTSDTSTSYASLPPAESKAITDATTSVTPILEMLDSSANDTIKFAKTEISPVSTPETPSPRTIMMPSNVPHPERISRVLRYNSVDSQTIDGDKPSSMKNDRFVFADVSRRKRDKGVSSKHDSIFLKESSLIGSKYCSCQNPQCRLLHFKLDNIHDYALKNCPEILKKYEDLQNMCTERIASLTDLIEKVRHEQRGMDFSLIGPADETSFMQLTSCKPMAKGLWNVRKLIKSIDTIHDQLAKTLHASQKIITNEVDVDESTSRNAGAELSNSSIENKFKQTVSATTERNTECLVPDESKPKPKIISEEKVNFQFNRFKIRSRPQPITLTPMLERNSWPPRKQSVLEESSIERLSKEILEQSQGLDKATSVTGISRDSADTSHTNKKRSVNNPDVTKNNDRTKSEAYVFLESKNVKKATGNDEDFVPVLAGIPKNPPMLHCTQCTNGRSRPPVTLHSGFYGDEIESAGHELSTIVEFDTPDTVTRNQICEKSTPMKCVTEKVVSDLQVKPIKQSLETQTDKSSVLVKPSIHVAVSPIQRSDTTKLRVSPTSTKKPSSEISTEKLPGTLQTHKEHNGFHSGQKSKDITDFSTQTRNDIDEIIDSIPDKVNKQLQCGTSSQEAGTQKNQHQFESTTESIKPSKDKISSTSSNSFSGLSGISEIASTPSSEILKYASSPEEMEIALKKLGLSWAITTLKKTREASALSSSSNSDLTPINTARRMISPSKKHLDANVGCLPDFSDVSSISIKEASKSTDQAVLLKGRTSTPKPRNSNSTSEKSNLTNTNSSGMSFQERSDSLTAPNVSLTKSKCNMKESECA